MKVDVLVCGGGCAGLGAAIAAARKGAKVLLLERAPFAGGIITAVGLPFLDGLACWHTGRIVVRGLALEALARLGACSRDARNIEEIKSSIGGLTRHGSVGIPNVDRFKILADEMLVEAGVKVLYHAMVCGAETDGHRLTTVLVATKSGLLRIEPSVAVDATGDADLAHYAGCPMDPDRQRMPMTMHFRIGNVRTHKEFWNLARAETRRQQEAGELPHYYGPGLATAFAPNEVYIHAVRVPGDAIDAFDLSRCEMQGRRDAWTMFQGWKKNVPGFEDSYFIGSGPYIGVRETRRIAGAYVLTGEDLVERRAFDDAIATGSWYPDIHPNLSTEGSAHTKEQLELKVAPQPYDIPYGSIVARGVENLLVAGRCHSADRTAASSTRVTVTAMALGEAAGAAAAMAAAQRTAAAGLDGRQVRRALAEMDAGPFSYADASWKPHAATH